MQSNEGRIRGSQKVPTKVKEVAMAALLLCAGGSALAWGVGQMYKPASSTDSPDDQCRMLANALLAGDSEYVFQHLNPTDAKHLKMDLFKLKAFQEGLLAPRLSEPYAWRPRQNRAFSCQGSEGIIFVHMDEPARKTRTAISLFTKTEKGAVSFRYDDLLKILSSLDQASNLTKDQRRERMAQDAKAMAGSKLDGFSLLHPGPEAEAIYQAELDRLKEARERAMKQIADGRAKKTRLREQVKSQPFANKIEAPVSRP